MVCFGCFPKACDPFWLRVLSLFFFLNIHILGSFGNIKIVFLRKLLVVLLFFISFIPLLIASIIINCMISLNKLGVTVKTLIFTILSILAVGGSLYMFKSYPDYSNPLSNFLSDILVATFTLFLGMSINKKRIQKEATDKWMPAAEGGRYPL